MTPSTKRPRSRDTFHCGFVSILGLPNAGKSTLLNALLGTKVAIVASKPQTTRTTIQGVVHMPKAQIVLLDTPGIHKSDSLINRRMMEQVRSAAQDRDLLLFVTDATRVPHAKETQAIDLIKSTGTPTILVLNKVDKIEEKGELFERISQFKEIHDFVEYVPISALRDDGIEDLKKTIAKHLPLRQPMFPDDYLTDQPERFLASELVREKILRATHEEVPHAVAVVVEKWEDTAETGPHHGDDLRRAARAEDHRHRQRRGYDQANRSESACRHRGPAREESVPRAVRQSKDGLA